MSARPDPVSRLAALLDEGVATGIFPAAQAVVLHRGRELLAHTAGAATPRTRFDLASLTKVMATTPLFMRLWAKGRLGPDTEIARFLPKSAAAHASIRLADLLTHRSGLPAFVPFFADVLREVPRLCDADCPPAVRAEARAHVVRRAEAVRLERATGTQAVYSDVGFILLGEALAKAADAPLDEAFDTLVAAPLELGARFRRLSTSPPDGDFAPTGRTRPREPAPEQEALWGDIPTVPTRPGEVDDDNAFVMDGVAGHAGLFGTALDVARFGQRILEELDGAGRIAPSVLWTRALMRDVTTPKSARAFGFDTPTEPSSAGRYIGNQPPGAVGHLGFTGTSLWIDRARSLVVALVTNRTYNGRHNVGIREFRPRFHDAVVEAFGL